MHIWKKMIIHYFKEMMQNNYRELQKYDSKINDDELTKIESIINEIEQSIINFKKLLPYSIYDNCNEKQIIFLEELFKIIDVFSNNQIITMPKELEESIKQNEHYHSIMANVKNKKNEFSEKVKLIKRLKNEIELLKSVIDYIEKLGETDYIEISNEINALLYSDTNTDINKKIEIIKSISKYNIQVAININARDNQFKIIPNISQEELIKLFQEYGYDYNKIPNEIKEKIEVYGNIDNIRYVFEFYKLQNIKFVENNKSDLPYIYVLFKSDKEVIDSLINTAKENNLDIKDLLRKTPSAFIHKGSNNSKNEPSEETNSTINIFGANEDFISNIKLFKEIGYDIAEIYKKCSSIFVYPNYKIKENIALLKLYGIDLYQNKDAIKLSGLKSTDILLTIDQFIELGELDYLLENTSRLALNPDDALFYRIWYIKNYNLENPQNEIKYKNYSGTEKITYKTFMSQNNETVLGITQENKREKTGAFRPKIFIDAKQELLQDTLSLNGTKINSEIFNSIGINLLEDYFKQGNLTYKIGNKEFSRLKVLRIYSCLSAIEGINETDLLLYCLTYNSILSEADYEMIKGEIISRKRG